MEHSYEQLNTKYVETSKVSPSIKYAAILLALIFTFIPLAELANEFNYHFIKSESGFTCFPGYGYDSYPIPEPLKFKEGKPIE